MVIRNFFVVLFGFAFSAQLALAQVNTATISGTVHDESGAVLPGANVVIQNQDTGISRTVITNETGRYSAPALGLGAYQVTVQLSGFQTQVRSAADGSLKLSSRRRGGSGAAEAAPTPAERHTSSRRIGARAS